MNVKTKNIPATFRFLLLLSGIIAIGIACAILFAPQAFYAKYGIEMGNNANLANELKAPSGVLLAAGLLMLAGVVNSELTFISTLTAAVVYLSYGLSRLSSMVTDGLPDAELVSATLFELVIGMICSLALIHLHKTKNINPK